MVPLRPLFLNMVQHFGKIVEHNALVFFKEFVFFVVSVKSPLEKKRFDTSLGLLTKKFVGLLRSAPDGVSCLEGFTVFADLWRLIF